MSVLKFTEDAVADIKAAISKNLRGSLKKALLESVARDPVGYSRELRGELEGYRSFKWQEYRVVCKIFPDLRAIAVAGVGLRTAESTGNIYRRLETLAKAGELAQGILFSIRGFTHP